MKHLTPSEFIDAAEDALAAARAAHLDACADCRAQAANLTAALRQADAGEIPEPSPLFWNHLSARVREAVATESIAPRSVFGSFLDGWNGLGRQAPTLAGVMLAVAVGALMLLSRHERAPELTQANAGKSDAAVMWTSAEVNPADSEVWEV